MPGAPEGQAQAAAEALLADASFCAALDTVEAARAAAAEQQRAAQDKKLATDPAAIAAEIEQLQQQRAVAVAAHGAAADKVRWTGGGEWLPASLLSWQAPLSLLTRWPRALGWSQVLAVLEQHPSGVPPALQPAVTALLRFYHADAPGAGPAARLSREVQLLLEPTYRASVAAALSKLRAHGGKQGSAPAIVPLPPALMAEGMSVSMLPGGRTCSLYVDRSGCLLMGGAAPSDTLDGLPAGGGEPLNLQALAFGLAVLERQVRATAACSVWQLAVLCCCCGCCCRAHDKLCCTHLPAPALAGTRPAPAVADHAGRRGRRLCVLQRVRHAALPGARSHPAHDAQAGGLDRAPAEGDVCRRGGRQLSDAHQLTAPCG